jgi:hypothetical protein
LIVFIVGSDPEPCDGVFVKKSQCPVSQTDTNGIKRLIFLDALEEKAGVSGVVPP